MKDLIEALTILSKYMDEGSYHSRNPTYCGFEWLGVYVDRPVSDEDAAKLEELGFSRGDEIDGDPQTSFSSHTFGSC